MLTARQPEMIANRGTLTRIHRSSTSASLAYLRPDVVMEIFKHYPRGVHFSAPPVYHSSKFTGADAYTWVEPWTRTAVVSFRGSHELRDLFYNADMGLVDYRRHGRVHRGFLIQYESIEDSIREFIERARAEGEVDRVESVGHSLGGALATLFAIGGGDLPASLVTFGSPMVGDDTFAQAQKYKGLSEVLRVVHSNDPIPNAPPSGLYAHLRGRSVRCFMLKSSQRCRTGAHAFENHSLDIYRALLTSIMDDLEEGGSDGGSN